jgi:hypothetical protein
MVAGLLLPLVCHAAEPIDIGSRRELFVDRYLIDHLDGARLEMHRPQPREVMMRFELKDADLYSFQFTTRK